MWYNAENPNRPINKNLAKEPDPRPYERYGLSHCRGQEVRLRNKSCPQALPPRKQACHRSPLHRGRNDFQHAYTEKNDAGG